MRTKPLMLAIALGLGLAMPGLQARPTPEAPQTQVQDLPLWLVVFDEPGAAAFRGFPASDRLRPALAATSPAATGARKYDAASPEARSYLGYLDELRRLRLGDAAAAVGRPLQAHYVYRHALNAVAVRISAEEAAVIAGLPGIRAVRPDFAYAPESDRSAAWVNADDVWNGNVPGVPARRGAGAIVGVVDGGINRSHTAFSGAGITNPRGAGNFLGWCSTNPSACNGKVIGLYDFIASGTGMADPSADASHGTHVASIAVGAQWLTYSGIAPDASLVHYRGCCTSTALLKSIDQGVADGVDVITMSIGGEQLQDPWTGVASAGYYDDAEAFLAAREAGIVVVKSAGNQGAGAGTITYPGNSPWMIAVAAASHDRYGTANGDRIATWSSRGPSVPFGVIKPDITAPGVDIDAAGTSGLASVARMSGTSMAAPQVAGAAAVLISIDPSRTPDQVVSALMLTARPTAKTGPITAADPHTRGAGVLDVARAARAGLYLAVPPNAFRNARANDWTGGAQNLNLPSLSHAACFRSCSLTRTFTRMPGSPASTYNVSVTMEDPQATLTPSLTSFVASNGGTAITFNVDVDDPALVDRWLYGTVTLTSTAGDGSPELRLPVAIYASPFSSEAAAAALAPIARTVDGERGFFDIDVSGMVPFTDARFATTDLVAPVVTTQTIPADPTTNPYDNPAQNYVRLVPVPIDASGAPFLVEASTSAANPDIDLYVGFDTNGNGLPDAGEELCDSISTGSNESCTVELTTGATAGNVWVMVQNYGGPGTNVTVRTLGLSTVASDAPTLVATGPGRVPEGAPFKLRVAWDDPGFVAGAERYGYLITRTAAGGNPIFTRLRLTRSGTGVVPYALAPAAARTVFLPAGGAHDRLYFDVPPGVTKMTLRTSNGSGSVSLYAARIDQPAGPVVAAAPPRGSASHSATGAGANQTIVINNPAAGRWYVTPVNTGGGTAKVDVSATIDTASGVPALRRGSYFNPSRGGHGFFVYPSGSDLALLWYTYLQDGTPTWYYAQAAAPGSNQVWSAPVYRAAWNGASRTLTPIGNVVLTPRAAGQLAVSYNIDGFTGAETLDTFLTGCPVVSGTPLNVSAHWFDEASPGYGYSVQVAGNYEFLATFVYDALGVPRFLSAERGGTFNAADTNVQLFQLQGFAPLGTHATPTYNLVGTLTRSYGPSTIQTIGTNATFTGGVPGSWSRSANVTMLSSQPQGCD